MMLQTLHTRPSALKKKKVADAFLIFEQLITELQNKSLSDKLVQTFNQEIDALNSDGLSDKVWSRLLKRRFMVLLKLLEKEAKLVPKNYYRNTWMAIGMVAFGLPLGVAFGSSLQNMAFIGIGLPIGMTLGIAFGTKKDKEAAAEGRQLNVDLK